MKGHEALVKMRRRGLAPTTVFLAISDPLEAWLDWPKNWPDCPSILIEPNENPRRLDLRWVVNLNAVVVGDEPERIKTLTDAVVRAGAKRVMAAVTEPNGGGYYRVAEAFDTALGAQWQSC